MSDRTIILKTPQVRALLRGATQLRLPVKPQPPSDTSTFLCLDKAGWVPGRESCGADFDEARKCPYGKPGDRLLIKETWCYDEHDDTKAHYRATEPEIEFLADGDGGIVLNRGGTAASPWQSPVTMPAWAVRLKPIVKAVQVERLHNISEDDAIASGMEYHDGRGIGHSGWRHDRNHGFVYNTARDAIERAGWDAIYGKHHPWSENPWTWACEIETEENQ